MGRWGCGRCCRSPFCCQAMFYNKAMLTAADFPNGPSTWDDVTAAAEKIKSAWPQRFPRFDVPRAPGDSRR